MLFKCCVYGIVAMACQYAVAQGDRAVIATSNSTNLSETYDFKKASPISKDKGDCLTPTGIVTGVEYDPSFMGKIMKAPGGGSHNIYAREGDARSANAHSRKIYVAYMNPKFKRQYEQYVAAVSGKNLYITLDILDALDAVNMEVEKNKPHVTVNVNVYNNVILGY